MTIEEKIERFFWELEKLMEKHGFNDVDGDETKYCRDGIGWLEGTFEKDDKYVDVDLKILLEEDCEYRDVTGIVIYYDEDIMSFGDELYNKIIELYKKFFKNKNNSR